MASLVSFWWKCSLNGLTPSVATHIHLQRDSPSVGAGHEDTPFWNLVDFECAREEPGCYCTVCSGVRATVVQLLQFPNWKANWRNSAQVSSDPTWRNKNAQRIRGPRVKTALENTLVFPSCSLCKLEHSAQVSELKQATGVERITPPLEHSAQVRVSQLPRGVTESISVCPLRSVGSRKHLPILQMPSL